MTFVNIGLFTVDDFVEKTSRIYFNNLEERIGKKTLAKIEVKLDLYETMKDESGTKKLA